MIGVLLDTSVRVSIIAVGIGALLAVLRVQSSSVRHAAWTTVLFAMLLMPVLTQVVPALPVTAAVQLPPLGPFRGFSERRAPEETSEFVRVQLPDSRMIVGAVTLRPRGTLPASERRGFGSTAPASPTWPQMAVAICVLGGVVSLGRLFIGWVIARQLARRWTRVYLRCEERVFEWRGAATPFTAGVFNPCIVLPASWREWPADRLRAVLAHERAHIKRRDPLIASLARLNRCIFWFHPLAWWLERTLAIGAEHACDDEAVRAMGERRRYAEMLLDMAEAVRRGGGRVMWQGIGIGGNGLLGQRIDRVLGGDRFRLVSRSRKAVVFGACASTIVVVVACRQPREAPPLREDPEVARNLQVQKADRELYERARQMTAEQVDELEAGLKKNPDDFVALKKLRTFYQFSGQKVFGWNEMIARRLPHILRMIDEHPEHDLALWRVSPSGDPAGYAEAKKHWLAQAAKPGVTAKSLTNAAQFFDLDDPNLAETLLLRARALDPEARTVRFAYESTTRPAYWSTRLGRFYGRALAGPRSPKDGRPLQPLDSDPYARDLRTRLTTSADAALLAAAGTELVRASFFDPARRQLGQQYLERARQLDPSDADARRMLVSMEADERGLQLAETVRTKQAELAGGEIARKHRAGERLTEAESETFTSLKYDAVSSLPETDRFPALGALAGDAYMWAEYLENTKKNAAGAKSSYERSKRAAQDALALGSKLRDHPAYSVTIYKATIALGTHALRDGDRASAVRYMLDAVKVSPSEQFAASLGMSALSVRLVNYLLKAGERESVAEYLEGSAALHTAERERLLKDAAAVRAGVMPMSYQYTFARR